MGSAMPFGSATQAALAAEALFFFSDNPHQARAAQNTPPPPPLEVEAAELAGDVDHFSDEKKAGHFSGCHGLGRKFAGIDAARGDFRFSVTLSSFRLDFPCVQLTFGVSEGAIGVARQRIRFQPAIR